MWFQFMRQMPATDFKVKSLTAKNVLGTRTRSQPPVLELEVNHLYSYSKILKASTRYSYSKVEYSTPSPVYSFHNANSLTLKTVCLKSVYCDNLLAIVYRDNSLAITKYITEAISAIHESKFLSDNDNR